MNEVCAHFNKDCIWQECPCTCPQCTVTAQPAVMYLLTYQCPGDPRVHHQDVVPDGVETRRFLTAMAAAGKDVHVLKLPAVEGMTPVVFSAN